MSEPIKLGNKVRDIISGVVGIVTARTDYFDSNTRYSVTPESVGGKCEEVYLNGERLEFLENGFAITAPGEVMKATITPCCARGLSLTPPRIGAEWSDQGGIYAGIMRGENGAPDYHLIAAPAPVGQIEKITWGGAGVEEKGALSDFDGLANTKALCASDIKHPAAQWAAGLSFAGHADWYLPARKEARLLAVNIAEFFEKSGWYWTSTQYAGTSNNAWIQDFEDGDQYDGRKTVEYRARAVRRLVIQ